MIPFVLLDLDGTVIGSSGQVLSCVWDAVEDAQAAGIKLAVCTGRPRVGVAKRVAERLGKSVPHIFQNGAMTAYADGDVVELHALKEASTRALIAHARAHNLVLEVYTSNALYVERRTPSERSAREDDRRVGNCPQFGGRRRKRTRRAGTVGRSGRARSAGQSLNVTGRAGRERRFTRA